MKSLHFVILMLLCEVSSGQVITDYSTRIGYKELRANDVLHLPPDTILTSSGNATPCSQLAKKNGIIYNYNCLQAKWIPLSNIKVTIIDDVNDFNSLTSLDSLVFWNDNIRGGYFIQSSIGPADEGVIFSSPSGYFRRQFNQVNGINTRWYGLSANGVTDDAEKIQAAIDRASVDSTNKVIIPAGHYLIGTALKLPSNFQLFADHGAYIELKPGSNSYLVRNEDLVNGNENIKVIGGHWNGNGWTQTRTLGASVAASNFCYGFFFHKSTNIEVGNLQIDSTRSWAISAMVCNYVYVHDIHFEQNPYLPDGVTPGLAENGDGFTFNASNVVAHNLWGFTNDDMVAAAAGGAIFSGEFAPFEQLDYENITMFNIYPSVRGIVPTWRAVGLYAFAGHKLSNVTINNISGTTASGMVLMADAMGDRGYFSNITINNVSGNNLSVAGSDPAQFGIISAAAASIDNLIINGSSRIDQYNTAHFKTTDSTYIDRLAISNINIRYKGQLGRLVDDAGKIRNLNITNVSLKDSAEIVGQRLYDRAASPFNSDTTLIKISSSYATRPPGFYVISEGSGKVSLSSTSIIVPDTTFLSPKEGDIIVAENTGLTTYQNGRWNSVNSFFTKNTSLVYNTDRSVRFIGVNPSGDYNVDILSGTGAARDVLRAGVAGFSNGFTVTYDGSAMNYSFQSGPVSLNGIKWSTGSGSPEGVITAPVGSFFSRTDGGSGTSFYVKESGSGNTGWVAK